MADTDNPHGLPWRIWSGGTQVYVDNSTGNAIAAMVDDKKSVMEARAAFILRAANSHHALLAALEKAIADYGNPGGPWNVPSEPGTWIAMARDAVAQAKGEKP